MSAVKCVLLRTNGSVEEVSTSHESAHRVLSDGPLTIVGAIDALKLVAVTGTNASTPNPHATHPEYFENDVKGDVLFVRTVGDDAVPTDVHAHEILALLDVAPKTPESAPRESAHARGEPPSSKPS